MAGALTQNLLLETIGSSVIPLPRQIYALSRAMSGDCVRYLRADEVGLGKTVEAGFIMRELKLRGLAKRIARYKLGRALAGAAPHLLLLTATPHRGKSDAFRRLVSMVDKHVLPDSADISSERVQEIVIRTE